MEKYFKSSKDIQDLNLDYSEFTDNFTDEEKKEIKKIEFLKRMKEAKDKKRNSRQLEQLSVSRQLGTESSTLPNLQQPIKTDKSQYQELYNRLIDVSNDIKQIIEKPEISQKIKIKQPKSNTNKLNKLNKLLDKKKLLEEQINKLNQ